MYDAQVTSTYRALICQEIADSICEFLDPSYYDQPKPRRVDKIKLKENKSTLAKLARTCKALSDPALRVLWRRLDGIDKLLKLLPQYQDPDSSASYTLDPEIPELLSSVPDDHEWARLQSYAVRVEQLNCNGYNPVDPTTWAILSQRCDGKPLCPRLKRLRNLDVQSAGGSDAVALLFPPSLRHLALSFYSWLEDLPDRRPYRETLQDIVARVPHLQHLALGKGIGRCASLHPITELRKLQSLSFASDVAVDDVLLNHCASLPALRDLSFKIGTRRGTSLPSIEGAFQLLTRISIHGTATDIVWFFRRISTAGLRNISLTLEEATGTSELVRGISAVLETVSPSLREFSLEITTDFPERLSLLEAVEPLLNLRLLQKFSVKSRQPTSLSGDDCVRMVMAWPEIRVLHIDCYRVRSSPVDLPAHLLEHIALRCPHLESLELPELDFTGLPPQAHEPLLDHRLVDLDFYPTSSYRDDSDDEQEGSSSRDATVWLNAALFVDRLFPVLDLDSSEKRNGRIMKFLSALQAGRRHAEAFDRMRLDDGGEPFLLPPILS